MKDRHLEDIETLVELFKALGDMTRLHILFHLFNVEEINVTDLAESVEMTSSAVSHQLKILKMTKLVKSRREGKTVYYSLADDHIRNIIRLGYVHVKDEDESVRPTWTEVQNGQKEK